ncbi:MAG: hypothetical protein QOE34_1988 [Verrucomicrobiota bacterium]
MFRPLLAAFLALCLSPTARAASVADVQAPLDQFIELQNIGGQSVRLAIHDEGQTSIRVVIGYARPVVFEKAKGIDPGTDETMIYSNEKSRVYYVASPSGKIGYCLLRVRSD